MPDTRTDVISGLRALADLLETEPAVPTPSVGALHTWGGDDPPLIEVLAALRPDPPTERWGFAAWERGLGGPGSRLGGVSYQLYTRAGDSGHLTESPVSQLVVRPELLAAAAGQISVGAGL